MIEIRVRHDYDAEAVRLCDWPADQLDSVLFEIGRWGLHSDAGDYSTSDLVGQIRVDDTTAYFEIVIVTEDDDAD